MGYYNRYGNYTTNNYINYSYYRDERTGKTYCIKGYYAFPPSYIKMITKKEFEESKKNA